MTTSRTSEFPRLWHHLEPRRKALRQNTHPRFDVIIAVIDYTGGKPEASVDAFLARRREESGE